MMTKRLDMVVADLAITRSEKTEPLTAARCAIRDLAEEDLEWLAGWDTLATVGGSRARLSSDSPLKILDWRGSTLLDAALSGAGERVDDRAALITYTDLHRSVFERGGSPSGRGGLPAKREMGSLLAALAFALDEVDETLLLPAVEAEAEIRRLAGLIGLSPDHLRSLAVCYPNTIAGARIG